MLFSIFWFSFNSVVFTKLWLLFFMYLIFYVAVDVSNLVLIARSYVFYFKFFQYICWFCVHDNIPWLFSAFLFHFSPVTIQTCWFCVCSSVYSSPVFFIILFDTFSYLVWFSISGYFLISITFLFIFLFSDFFLLFLFQTCDFCHCSSTISFLWCFRLKLLVCFFWFFHSICFFLICSQFYSLFAVIMSRFFTVAASKLLLVSLQLLLNSSISAVFCLRFQCLVCRLLHFGMIWYLSFC